jgi:zinc finger protein
MEVEIQVEVLHSLAECGERNNEIQFGGTFGEFHTKYEVEVTDSKDLDRQVVKSEYATIFIPEIQLEIPADSQKGTLNTIEGVLMVTQPRRLTNFARS